MGKRSDLLTVPQQISGSAGTGLKSSYWSMRGSSQDSPRSWPTSPPQPSTNQKDRATPGWGPWDICSGCKSEVVPKPLVIKINTISMYFFYRLSHAVVNNDQNLSVSTQLKPGARWAATHHRAICHLEHVTCKIMAAEEKMEETYQLFPAWPTSNTY